MTPTASVPEVADAPKADVAASAKEAVAAPAKAQVLAPALVLSPDNDVRAFCANIGRAASDARVAWQAARLTELENALKTRIEEYESKTAEWRDWLARRDEALKRADDSIVAIYSRMKPEAAAAQLGMLDDGLAAAILGKLNARSASAVLGEMSTERAARLADEMSGARIRLAEGKKTQ